MRRLAMAAIRAYQTYVSPYKGFRCAYRATTGRASCSALGYRTIRRHGVLGGVALLRRRTHLCGVAHRRALHARRALPRRELGICDCGCDLPCDVSCCDLPTPDDVCDLADCCDCDWPRRNDKRRTASERTVYIPFSALAPDAPAAQARSGR